MFSRGSSSRSNAHRHFAHSIPAEFHNRVQLPLKSFRCCPVYRVDLVVVIMFAGSILDAWTTWVFASRPYGFEQNPTLAPLLRHSLMWIPIYLLCPPLMVPLLPEVCRLGFTVYFGFAGFVFGVNNLSGIFYGRYFLIDLLGFAVLQGSCILFGLTVFIWTVWKHAGNAQERMLHIITGICCIGLFLLLELGFFVIGRVALT
jgi:hypothetical protein